MEFQLSSGHRILVGGFFIGPTNTWIDHLKESLSDKALPLVRRFLPVGDYHVVGDTCLEFVCVATFNTVPFTAPDSFGYYLHLVWFVDDMNVGVRDLVEKGLADCDWELHGREILRCSEDD